MSLVWDLEDIGRDHLSEVGAKGANAGELKRLGFHVPDGFCISIDGHNRFIKANDLAKKVESLLEEGGEMGSPSLDSRRRQLAALYDSSAFPSDLEEEILTAWSRHFTGEIPAAVRSSCTAEDHADASFAGQYRTILNVKSERELLTAIKKTWVSLLNSGAISYQRARRIGNHAMRMAVLVQKMVPGEISGVLFTVNPVSLNDRELVIDASWGLGPPIVAGAVTPDHFVLDKTTRRVVEQHIASKPTQVVMGGGGDDETVIVEVSTNKVNAPTLSQPQAVHLCNLGMEIESYYGVPQDIEWSFHRNNFYILQSRPITTL